MCFTIRHGERLGETLKLPRLSRVSEAATFRLGLVSNKILNVSVSSQSRRYGSRISFLSRLSRSCAHPCRIHKHSLTSYARHTAARQSNLVIDWLLKATDQDRRNLSTFFYHFNVYFAWSDFPR